MPIVTGLRARDASRVVVELDGRPWRIVPAEAVLAADLDIGRELDRERARRLRRELVRLRALGVASSALQRRDLSARRLAERLDRAGMAPETRRRAIEALERAGLVDDARFAHTRSQALADRGYGNAAIDADLERQGVPPDVRAGAIDALPSELERLEPVLRRRGTGARTARYVAHRGFGEDAVAVAGGVGFANDP